MHVQQNILLSSNEVANATEYDVYFENGDMNPMFVSTMESNFDPGVLTLGATYYWKVVPKDSIAISADPDAYSVWSFTVKTSTSGLGKVPCDGGDSSKPAVTTNPDLITECASLTIGLVIDESYSITFGPPEDSIAVGTGVLAFLNTLSCSGAQLVIIEFDAQARYVQYDYRVVDQNYVSDIEDYFSGAGCQGGSANEDRYNPDLTTGNTNWHSALIAPDSLPFAPDWLLLFTDGVPSVYSQSGWISDTIDNRVKFQCDDLETVLPGEL